MSIQASTRRPAYALAAVVLSGCATTEPITVAPEPPDVAPAERVSFENTLKLDASVVRPMHHEMVAIDLPTVVQVAMADNIDIRQARLQVQASQGLYDGARGRALPTISPLASFEVVNGAVRATRGNIVDATFDNVRALLVVDWVINPGLVAYEIIAARKRLAATEHQERAITVGTLHKAVNQYYGLILSQSRVETAHGALDEAVELLRINELRFRAGTGVKADTLRAQSHLAEREQDLLIAMNSFYQASVSLSVTLRLDSWITMVPKATELGMVTLVRNDLSIENLLEVAVTYRPDLESVRKIIEAVAADTGAVAWGGFGPSVGASYVIGGINGSAENVGGIENKGGFTDTQRFGATVGFRFSAESFGNLRAAKAVEAQAILEGQRMLDVAKAQVVTALESSRTNSKLVQKARLQVNAASEGLRLTQANLKAGTMTTLDVLEAADAMARAHLRHARAIVGYNQSQVDLLAALGLVSKDSLGVTFADAEPDPQSS